MALIAIDRNVIIYVHCQSYLPSLEEIPIIELVISSTWPQIDARRITIICALLLCRFLAGYLAVAGLNLLAQLSVRIHHFTALNSVHFRKLG